MYRRISFRQEPSRVSNLVRSFEENPQLASYTTKMDIQVHPWPGSYYSSTDMNKRLLQQAEDYLKLLRLSRGLRSLILFCFDANETLWPKLSPENTIPLISTGSGMLSELIRFVIYAIDACADIVISFEASYVGKGLVTALHQLLSHPHLKIYRHYEVPLASTFTLGAALTHISITSRLDLSPSAVLGVFKASAKTITSVELRINTRAEEFEHMAEILDTISKTVKWFWFYGTTRDGFKLGRILASGLPTFLALTTLRLIVPFETARVIVHPDGCHLPPNIRELGIDFLWDRLHPLAITRLCLPHSKSLPHLVLLRLKIIHEPNVLLDAARAMIRESGQDWKVVLSPSPNLPLFKSPTARAPDEWAIFCLRV